VSAARAASAKQGDRIVVLDVRDLIVITDYFVIASGSSDRQVRTIVGEVEKSLRTRVRRGGTGVLRPGAAVERRAGGGVGRGRSGIVRLIESRSAGL